MSTRTVDLGPLIEMLNDMKEGKDQVMTCPFCGGNVGAMEHTEESTIIGCDSCDMRIELSSI